MNAAAEAVFPLALVIAGYGMAGRRRHSRWPLDAGDRPPIREIDSDGEIMAIDVERDVDILGVQIRTARS